ncbi:MAG TPA: (Fe-S)-binding protein, partial [Verrucomicrobiae bacterium]
GRPAFSQGDLGQAQRLGRHNIGVLNLDVDQAPILFLEPSCYSMFVEDYRELKVPGFERVARRCFLFEQFIEELLSHEPHALQFKSKHAKVIIHAHCHVKSLLNPAFLRRLAERLPKREVTLLNTACCGMAGGFGMLEDNYELSLKVAEPLVHEIRAQPFGTQIVASGTSCRHQISHLTPVRPKHMAEVLAEALEGG